MRTVYHTVKFAKANGIRCIVNPAPAQPVDFKELGATDYFIPNESEAEVITGMPVQSIDEAKKCAEFLLRQGMKRVVITLGERGALAALLSASAALWRRDRTRWNSFRPSRSKP